MADDVDLAQIEIDWAQRLAILAATKQLMYLLPKVLLPFLRTRADRSWEVIL